ncbi:MAG: hypothetical protein AAF958_03320 [Planctomycetota bacterium]
MENRAHLLRHDASHRDGKRPGGGNILVWDGDAVSLLATAGALHHAGHRCVCAKQPGAVWQSLDLGLPDLAVFDVGRDANLALDVLTKLRQRDDLQRIPAILLAESSWAGLEYKAEKMTVATRCLFRPIDPQTLIDLVDSLLWMPALVSNHRRRGTQPSNHRWITLDC